VDRLPTPPAQAADLLPGAHEEYARQIARDWKVRDSGAGYVTRFAVEKAFLDRYEVHRVGSAIHDEYWIPAEELAEFNRHLVGRIEVIAEYRAPEAET
jgi:hypothetical protein